MDATQLSKDLPQASVTNIVAINVIDIISRSRLQDVVKEAHFVLKDDGNMVILADLPFNPDALIEKFSHVDRFLFPSCHGNDLGITSVSMVAFMQDIQSFGQHFVQFIQSLLKIPENERITYLMRTIKLELGLSEVLESICTPECYQHIDHKESYEKDLTEALTSHGGFEVVANGYEEANKIIGGKIKSDLPINFIGTDLRIPSFTLQGFIPKLKENAILIRSVFHVVIARKKRGTLLTCSP